MSGDPEIISTMDEIWAMLPTDAQKTWETAAMLEASSDPKIEGMLGFLPRCTGALAPEDLVRKIGEYLEERYDAVPTSRRPEVIRRAGGSLIWREMGFYGEA